MSAPPRAASSTASHAIGVDDHRDVRIERAVHERLVVAVAAQNDGRVRAARRQPARDPRGDRRLAGAADREIADAHRGDASSRSPAANRRRTGCRARRRCPPNTRSAGISTVRAADAIESRPYHSRSTSPRSSTGALLRYVHDRAQPIRRVRRLARVRRDDVRLVAVGDAYGRERLRDEKRVPALQSPRALRRRRRAQSPARPSAAR